jgi:CDP-diglyceride synthetase
MTAAITLPSTTITPRISRGTRRAIAVVAAAALFVAGVVVAPYLMLAIFVTIAVVLGMAEVGQAIDQTFESLVALES